MTVGQTKARETLIAGDFFDPMGLACLVKGHQEKVFSAGICTFVAEAVDGEGEVIRAGHEDICPVQGGMVRIG